MRNLRFGFLLPTYALACALLVASVNATFAVEGREWSRLADSVMIFGVPETDDVVMRLECVSGHEVRITIPFPENDHPETPISYSVGFKIENQRVVYMDSITESYSFGDEEEVYWDAVMKAGLMAPIFRYLEINSEILILGTEHIKISGVGFESQFIGLKQYCQK